MTRTMRNNIIIVIVVVLLSSIVGFFAARYLLKEDSTSNKTNNKIENKEEEKQIKMDAEVQTRLKKELTLFNTEATLSGMCSSNRTDCSNDLGKFSLGGVVHTAYIHYNLDDLYNEKLYEKISEDYPDNATVDTIKYTVMNNEKANYISIDYKKISIEPFTKLDKIVKIGDDHLAIGVYSSDPFKYIIKIYDTGLNLVKEYNGAIIKNSNFTEYFNVSKNTFTRYQCICKNDDPNEEYIQKYKVTITDDKFNEEKVSEEKTFCMQQCN